jgi:hypothetical protein
MIRDDIEIQEYFKQNCPIFHNHQKKNLYFSHKTIIMKKFTALTFGFCFTCMNFFAQNDVFLTVTHKFGQNIFSFSDAVQNNLGHNFNVSRVDYYISGIKIIHDGGTETPVPGLHLLVRASDNLSGIFSLGNHNVSNVEAITFSIGVDPSLNNADPNLQDEDSPLYFQFPSMHWGWTSGYRFVCMEGYAGANLTTLYQLHGLWNQNYFEQTVTLNAQADGDNNLYIHLNADYIEAMRGVILNTGPIHHGTNQDDLKVMMNFRDHVFSAGNGDLLSINSESKELDISIYPNPTNGLVTIHVNNESILNSDKMDLLVYDLYGRVVYAENISSALTNVNLADMPSGIYLFKLANDSAVELVKKVIKN